jgi:ribonuclease HI
MSKIQEAYIGAIGTMLILSHNMVDIDDSEVDKLMLGLRKSFKEDEKEALNFTKKMFNTYMEEINNYNTEKDSTSNKKEKTVPNKKPSVGKEVHIWTDGSSINNGKDVGAGGCGYVMLFGDFRDIDIETEYADESNVVTGYHASKETTNQREEIKAVIYGLQKVKTNKYPIKVMSDSAYLVNCMNDGWYKKWKKNGWKNSKGQGVANKDLWEDLLNIIKEKKLSSKLEFVKVKGHNKIFYNELADEMAGKALKESRENMNKE